MNHPISVVIVCKNEAHIIGKTLQSVASFADEILIYDTGSTDDTIAIAQQYKATIIQAGWEGYGPSKQKAVSQARNNWVMNLDADEVLDEEAQSAVKQLSLVDKTRCYRFDFTHFLGSRALHWGEFGFDSHVRLFNRETVSWNDALVHEKLQYTSGVTEQKLGGHILHYTMKNTADFVQKTVQYGLTNAQDYFNRGKKPTIIKQYVSPLFMFVKYYVFKLGLLDGWAGLFAARMASLYTYVKYARLRELYEESKAAKR